MTVGYLLVTSVFFIRFKTYSNTLQIILMRYIFSPKFNHGDLIIIVIVFKLDIAESAVFISLKPINFFPYLIINFNPPICISYLIDIRLRNSIRVDFEYSQYATFGLVAKIFTYIAKVFY